MPHDGTHGVGKTTLCVDIVNEVARRCPLPMNEETTLDAQSCMRHSQIAEKIEAGADYEVVVCDRSVLDHCTYLVVCAGRQPELAPLVLRWVRG
jgi:thymidylate kinase